MGIWQMKLILITRGPAIIFGLERNWTTVRIFFEVSYRVVSRCLKVESARSRVGQYFIWKRYEMFVVHLRANRKIKARSDFILLYNAAALVETSEGNYNLGK